MVATTNPDRLGLERNLRLIPLHAGLAGAFVWLPIFVLFTRARFDLDGALLLASLYYLFVVIFEVPSGWMSDRLGRVVTLRLAALCLLGAHLCFAVGDDRFAVILAGQVLLAGGFASLSGTDAAFHYDSLEALGRATTYADRQARVSAIRYLVGAVSAAIGGLLGLFDVRWAFVASAVLAACQLTVTFRLSEPPSQVQADSFGRQLVLCVGYLRDRYVGWIFFYGVIAVTLVHVAFTLMQPWLTAVLGNTSEDLGSTPAVAGATFAVVALVGAGAARASATVGRRLGVMTTLIGLSVVSAGVVTSMALWVNVLVLAVVALRSVQAAASAVLISEALASHSRRHHRATLLSINSLVGRLGYGIVLLFVSTGAQDDVQGVLATLAVVAWVLVAVLALTAVWAGRSSSEDGHTDSPVSSRESGEA